MTLEDRVRAQRLHVFRRAEELVSGADLDDWEPRPEHGAEEEESGEVHRGRAHAGRDRVDRPPVAGAVQQFGRKILTGIMKEPSLLSVPRSVRSP